MANWGNADTLAAYKKMLSLKGQVSLKDVLDAKRVKEVSVPMAAGLTYNYAAKEVNAQILSVLQELADEAELVAKFGIKQAPTLVIMNGDGFEKFRGVSDIKGYLMNK